MTQQPPTMTETVEHPETPFYEGEGFESFEVGHTVSTTGMLSISVRARYTMGRAVDVLELVEPVNAALAYVQDTARKALEGVKASLAAAAPPSPGVVQQPTVGAGGPQPQPVPPAPMAPAAPTAPAPAVGDGWATGANPSGATFRYRIAAVYPSDNLKADAIRWCAEQGLNAEWLVCYDNRTGPKGLEAGNRNWFVAIVKVVDGSPYAQVAGKRGIAAVEFEADGSLKCYLTKEGQAILAGLAMQQPQQVAPAAAVQQAGPAYQPPPPAAEVPF